MNNMTKLAEYESRKKSYGIAYLLWIVGGFLGAHRIFTRDYNIAAAWILGTLVTIADPLFFFKFYLFFSLVEWVAIGLRVKEINQEALVWLKHSDENGNLNPENNHPTSV